MIGEYDAAGNATREHVWFNGAPVAVITGSTIHYVHTDHLGTPRAVTQGGTAVWRWESDPFGSTAAQEDPDGDLTAFTYNLRFPGQYYDDETGLHYNYFRTYDPSTGRYLKNDPIGLRGGLNTYEYATQNPVKLVDPLGLFPGNNSIDASIKSAIARGDVNRLRTLLEAASDPRRRELIEAGIKRLTTRADDFIAQNCKASVNRRFPEQFRDMTLEEIFAAARAGDKAAKTAKKLLTDKRFLK